jgi:AcrR family transcriptional regulator
VVGVKGQVQRRGVERREAILDAAIEVFATSGARGGALAEVGRRAGTTRGGVLHHFGSKEELLLAAIKERDRRAGEDFLALAHQGGIAMLGGMTRFAEQNLREPGLSALHTTLLVENLHQASAARRYFARRATTVRQALASGLERGQERGEIRPDVDCLAEASGILAFQEGASILAQLDPTTPLTDLYRSFFDNLISRIATPTAASAAS